MDNNNYNNPQQFGGQPQQQFNGQPQQFNGQPQQQFYGQPQQQFYGQPYPAKAPLNINVKALIALILSAVGTILSILGTAFTCSCSASKTFDAKNAADGYATSLLIILAISGAIVALVGVVLALLALKDDRKNVMALIALALGVVGFAIGFLPAVTIGGYNCALSSARKKLL